MNLYRAIIVFFAILGLSSCEDTLDPKVDNNFGDEWTWKNPDKAQGVLMKAYSNIPGQFDYFGNNFSDVATDDAVTNNFSAGIYGFALGGQSAFSNPIGNWATAYTQLAYIHLFLENGLDDNIIYYLPDATINEDYRTRLKGEAYFLRAWWSMELLRRYGGITVDGEALGYCIVTETLDAEDGSAGLLPRNTYEECVKQIISDCDTAIAYLPSVYNGSNATDKSEIGRATKKTAYALKSRAYTYAASPAYQPEGSYSISEDSIQSKWERAALASYSAIVDGQIGNYAKLSESDFNLAKETPSGFIFRKYHNNNSLETRNFPPSQLGAAFTQPSQNLVDAFPASNGYPIDRVESGYDSQDPYSNRDPRLDLTVYYNGRPAELNGNPLEIYYDVDNEKPGMDAPGNFNDNTRTGYYLRKWISQKQNMLAVGAKQNDHHYHALMRRAEIYLNWAEASNEAVGPNGIVPGCDRSAYDIIKTIRNKALGISSDPYLDEVASQGKEAFRALIQNERRVELAFENHRYFDMRRCKLPLTEVVRGCKIEKSADILTFIGTDPAGNAIEVEERGFDGEKYYYSSLPYSELAKNPNLKNNKGWD